MHSLFQQINLSLPNFSIEQLKGEVSAEYINPITNKGFIAYKIADIAVLELLTQLAPLPNPAIAYTEISENLEPHRDFGGTCAINYYIETNDACTTFYTPTQTANQLTFFNGAEIQHRNNCTEVARFTANNNSSWILNIGELHSVTMPATGCRRIISIGYPQHDFQTVRDKLKALWC